MEAMNATDNKPRGKKMQVKIVETGAIEELCAIDGATGCEWTADLIGNHDAFNASQFYREQDEDGEDVLEYWAASQAEYNWWAAVVAALNKADALKAEAKAAGLWSEEVERDYLDVESNDLDTHAAACVQFLEDLIGVKS